MRVPHVWTCFLLAWLFMKTKGKNQAVYVTCQFSESCVLPCTFSPKGGEKIIWIKQDSQIYSHPQESNQNIAQLEGRTSIATGQLSDGNASLVLKHCGRQDRGRYTCRIIEGKQKNDNVIIVKMEAPIRSMNLQMSRLSGYEEVECSTSDVYPAPQVNWSTDPPTLVEKLKYTTRMTSDVHGLYFIDSKLRTLGNITGLTYICTINSSSQSWRASLTDTVQNNVQITSTSYSSITSTVLISPEGQEITIPCKIPLDLRNISLAWSFTRAGKTEVICSYDSKNQLVVNKWNSTAWLTAQRVQTGDASLRLSSPQSLVHTGIYTCNVSASRRTHVEQTAVNITTKASENQKLKTNSTTQWWIPVIVIALLVLLIAALVGLKKKREDSQSKNTQKDSDTKGVKGSEDSLEEVQLTSVESKSHT